MECSEERNARLFERVLLGYGQFGVITEATLRIRPVHPDQHPLLLLPLVAHAIDDLQ